MRLSGILDTLEARNRVAIDRKLAYTDFQTLLIQDEIARRDHHKLDARMRRANFCGQRTLEGFDFDRLPNLNRAVVHDLATCRFINEKVSVRSPVRAERVKAMWRRHWAMRPPGKVTMSCS